MTRLRSRPPWRRPGPGSRPGRSMPRSSSATSRPPSGSWRPCSGPSGWPRRRRRRPPRPPRADDPAVGMTTTKGTTMTTDRRIPLHLAVLVGASTAAYAISLAGVTALQSAADGAIVSASAPSADAASRLSDGHDRLQAELDAAARAYATSAARYDALSAEVTTFDATLERFTDVGGSRQRRRPGAAGPGQPARTCRGRPPGRRRSRG